MKNEDENQWNSSPQHQHCLREYFLRFTELTISVVTPFAFLFIAFLSSGSFFTLAHKLNLCLCLMVVQLSGSRENLEMVCKTGGEDHYDNRQECLTFSRNLI